MRKAVLLQSRKYVKFFRNKIVFRDLKVHFKPMVYMFGVSIASVIYLNSDITMLGLMKGDDEVGIYTMASKMNQMVKKLLTLNQLEFGNDQVNMERFDLTTLVRGVIQASAILAQQQGTEIIFRQDTPVYVWGDEFKVEEVVTNYLTNAIHYVKNENKIDIRFVQNGNAIKVIVFNTGDPIPEEDIEKVWIKFYKVDKARTREYGGSGIGLSIVKAIMDSMHQQCGVRNYTNGVAFWFTLESGGSSIEEDCNLL